MEEVSKFRSKPRVFKDREFTFVQLLAYGEGKLKDEQQPFVLRVHPRVMFKLEIVGSVSVYEQAGVLYGRAETVSG